MRSLVLLCTGIVVMTWFAHVRADRPSREKRVVGYFAEWSGTNAAELPADLLTHVNYAFARIKDGQIAIHDPVAAIEKVWQAGEDDAAIRGHFGQLRLLKQKHPHLRTMISIGGWGGSAHFSNMALSAESRERFARSCVEFVSKYGFDGVDIDWEYPGGGGKEPDEGRPEDTRNFTLLLAELRRQLDEQGRSDQKRYLLTIAAPAGEQNYRNIELDQIHPHLDWINLMTYDFTGSWSRITGFNAPLFSPSTEGQDGQRSSVDRAVRAYLDAGVPKDKLVVGVPFYGKAFGGVKNVNHGLFQPHDGKSPHAAGSGAWTYRNLIEHYIGKSTQRFWHEQAKVPWLYDEKTEVMITYDDPESLRLKADYVRANELRGVMIWELSQDDARRSLLSALHAGLQ